MRHAPQGLHIKHKYAEPIQVSITASCGGGRAWGAARQQRCVKLLCCLRAAVQQLLPEPSAAAALLLLGVGNHLFYVFEVNRTGGSCLLYCTALLPALILPA